MEKVADLLREYEHNDGTYQKVSELLLQQMDKGLDKSTCGKSSLKMLPTYVRALPDGSESGNILALDLGGTNFRVLLIQLMGKEVKMKNKIFPISEETMLGHGDKLFDHIAHCIYDFMKENDLHNSEKRLPLGFTFSFPCKQEGLNVGRLISWTKGFKCEGVEGEDVVKLLHEAIDRRGDLNVQCVAILNDTVGCLMSCAYADHDCEIGVILGTGTNACYMEKLDRVGTWDGDRNEPCQVIINTEWGAFGDNGSLEFLRTKEDRAIDQESLNPGKQVYEKMISGMFLGELARLVIVNAAEQKLVFGGTITEDLAKPHNFFTKYMSEIEKDTATKKYENTRLVLDELGYEDVSEEDCQAVHHICHTVGKRAAFLSATGIATLLNRINKTKVTVAIDGSLYRFHPLFHTFMIEKISQLVHAENKFSLRLSEDGSGQGAALVAAVAARMTSTN